MPVVEMGLNEMKQLENIGLDGRLGVEFDHIKFHKCVDFSKYQETAKIVFTPPDGEFELMNYLIKSEVPSLFVLTIDTIK